MNELDRAIDEYLKNLRAWADEINDIIRSLK